MIRPNSRCPVCDAHVYFYSNEFGSRVYFDEIGPPWPKHPCTDHSDDRHGPRRRSPSSGARRSAPGWTIWAEDQPIGLPRKAHLGNDAPRSPSAPHVRPTARVTQPWIVGESAAVGDWTLLHLMQNFDWDTGQLWVALAPVNVTRHDVVFMGESHRDLRPNLSFFDHDAFEPSTTEITFVMPLPRRAHLLEVIAAIKDTGIDPNSTCIVCDEDVFVYVSDGGKILKFDVVGPPWQRHRCTGSSALADLAELLETEAQRHQRRGPILSVWSDEERAHLDGWASNKPWLVAGMTRFEGWTLLHLLRDYQLDAGQLWVSTAELNLRPHDIVFIEETSDAHILSFVDLDACQVAHADAEYLGRVQPGADLVSELGKKTSSGGDAD